MLASVLLLKTDLRPPVSAGTMPSSTSAIRAVPASRLPSDDSLRDSNLRRRHLHPQHHRHHAQQCTVTKTGETTTASARTSSSDSSSCLCQLTKNASGDENRASLDRPNPSTPTCCRTASAPCGHPPRSSCFSSSSSSSSAWSPLVLLILLTSLGVTLAMPLSDNEKHYRELQSRAVVSGRRLFFLFVLFFVCCCFSFCVERLSRTQLMQRLCSRATHSLCHLPLFAKCDSHDLSLASKCHVMSFPLRQHTLCQGTSKCHHAVSLLLLPGESAVSGSRESRRAKGESIWGCLLTGEATLSHTRSYPSPCVSPQKHFMSCKCRTVLMSVGVWFYVNIKKAGGNLRTR